MLDHVKTVVKQDGKLAAYWQRSAGRPWIAVKGEGKFPTTKPFDDVETAREAARQAREAAFEKERQDDLPPTE